MPMTKEQRISSIATTCKMFGFPIGLIEKEWVYKLYRGMDLVAEGVWENIVESQKGLTADDFKGVAEAA